MSGKFEPFEIADLEDIHVQGRHAALTPRILARPLVFYPLMVGPWSWTYWTATGRPVACAGILPNGYAWAFLGADMRRDMIPFLRATQQVLEAHRGSTGPVRSEIDSSHPEAVRWARLLGFRHEAGETWIFA